MAEAKSEESSSDSVKGFVDKFGMSEILGHIFPGLIAICALLIWLPVDWLSTVFDKGELVFGALVLVVSYALGLVLSMFSRLGAEWFRTSYRPRLFTSPVFRNMYRLGKWWLQYLTIGVPEPKALMPTQSSFLDIQQKLQTIFGVRYMALLQRQDDQLEMLRGIASDRLKDLCAGTVSQAEILHQRLAFSLGAALAFLVLASSAAARLIVRKMPFFNYPGWANSKLLASVVVGGFFVSLLLRRVAAHLSERELVLTLGILRRFEYKF